MVDNKYSQHEEAAQNSSTSRWSYKDIMLLIDLWEIFLPQLRKTKRNRPIFEEITNRLQQLLQRTVPYSTSDVQIKIDTLKRQYSRSKRQQGKDSSPCPWRYFDRINRILASQPAKKDDSLHRISSAVQSQSTGLPVKMETEDDVEVDELSRPNLPDGRVVVCKQQKPTIPGPSTSSSASHSVRKPNVIVEPSRQFTETPNGVQSLNSPKDNNYTNPYDLQLNVLQAQKELLAALLSTTQPTKYSKVMAEEGRGRLENLNTGTLEAFNKLHNEMKCIKEQIGWLRSEINETKGMKEQMECLRNENKCLKEKIESLMSEVVLKLNNLETNKTLCTNCRENDIVVKKLEHVLKENN